MRELGGYIGAEVGWDSSNQVAIIEKYTDDSKKETTRIEVPIGYTKGVITKDYSNQTETQNLANIDDDNPVLPSLLINGSTYLPLIYISENMGYEVTYFSDGNEIHLTNDGNPAPTQSYKSVAEASDRIVAEAQDSSNINTSALTTSTGIDYSKLTPASNDSAVHSTDPTTRVIEIMYGTNGMLNTGKANMPYYGDPSNFNFASWDSLSTEKDYMGSMSRPTEIVSGVMVNPDPAQSYNTSATAFKGSNGEIYMIATEGSKEYLESYARFEEAGTRLYRDYTAEAAMIKSQFLTQGRVRDNENIEIAKDILSVASISGIARLDFLEAYGDAINTYDSFGGDNIFWNKVRSEIYAGEERPVYQGTYDTQLSIEGDWYWKEGENIWSFNFQINRDLDGGFEGKTVGEYLADLKVSEQNGLDIINSIQVAAYTGELALTEEYKTVLTTQLPDYLFDQIVANGGLNGGLTDNQLKVYELFKDKIKRFN